MNQTELFSRSGKRQMWRGVGALVASSVLFAGIAFAEQIQVIDENGNTQSMLQIAAGSRALVEVTLEPQGSSNNSGVGVLLLDSSTKAEKQRVRTNGTGVAEFEHVGAGSYAVRVVNSSATVANVKIVPESKTGKDGGQLSDNSARKAGKAMYVAGASAVAGVAGIAAAVSSSGSSNGSSSVGVVDTGAIVGGGAAPSSTAVAANGEVVVLGPSYDPNQPVVTEISPAPGTGNQNNTPGVGDPSNPPINDDTTEQPEGPDEIAPPPDVIDPMTPS